MVKIHKTMEKLKVGDSVRIKDEIGEIWSGDGSMDKYMGKTIIVEQVNEIGFESEGWYFLFSDIEEIAPSEQASPESQSKKIKQALRKICLSGLVIKSEKIISKVKQDIGTDYVFGDTILRALRQLRQDGEVDYTADKQTREYTFK